jgi:hypothetical protein
MYYLKTPPVELVRRVSGAIQVNIIPLYKQYWVDFFNQSPLQLYFQEDYQFDRIADDTIHHFTEAILLRPHLSAMDKHARQVLCDRYRECMFLFRDNLAMMGYSILILRKELSPVDWELFTSRKIT